MDELQRQFGYSDNVLRYQIVKVEDLDTEAAFMQNLIPPKEESSQPKQEPEKDVLANSENEKSDEEEQIEAGNQSESDKEESDSSAQEDDSETLEA